METKRSRLQSSSSSVSDQGKRSVSRSPRRGPSTPQISKQKINSDEENEPNDGELTTLIDANKTILDETSSNIGSDTEENHPKKRTHHRHHHRHHHKQSKSNKRSASHQRHSTKRSKKSGATTTHHEKSDDENSICSETKPTESTVSKSDQEASTSEKESNNEEEEGEEEEEGIIKGNNSPDERRKSRRRRKKHRSSSSVNERNSRSPQSSSSSIPKNNKGTQLIVNYLPSSLRESDFYQLFARVAPVKLCKLITDRHTGHSFCYGFIEYHNKDDALKAIEKYNGYKIENKKLKVSYAQPKSTSHANEDMDHEKSSGSTKKNPNIYITDLPDNFDEKMLERLFSKYGEIVKIKVLRDPRTRISRGVAFVLMTSTRYAERAVKALDGCVPSGARTPISVKYADQSKNTSGNNGNHISSSRQPNSPTMVSTIGTYGYPPGLPPFNMIDPYYAAAFHNHHRTAMNMRDLSPSPPPLPPLSTYYGSGNGRPYGNHASGGSSSSRTRTSSPGLARSYSSSSSKHGSNMNSALSTNVNNPSALAAACELISKGCQQAIDPNGFVIYAFGLPHDCDENDLEELFRRYGEVYRVYIVRNYATGESKGYSFVTMRNYDEACHAVNRLDGSTFQGRTIQVRFKQ